MRGTVIAWDGRRGIAAVKGDDGNGYDLWTGCFFSRECAHPAVGDRVELKVKEGTVVLGRMEQQMNDEGLVRYRDTSVAPGVVTYFSEVEGYGYVKTRGARLRFGCTTWDPGRPARWPRRNERCQVVFNHEDRVLQVRGFRRS
jgi:hypothetical protein